MSTLIYFSEYTHGSTFMAIRKRLRSKPRARAPATRPTGRRARNKAAIRNRIVTAALNLFQTKGFEATTTREIARKARIAEGTVFNYFKTKEDIALFFFEQEVDHAIATVRGSPRLRKAPLEEKLFALVQSQLEFLAPYERFIGAALVQTLKPASPLGPFSNRAQELRYRYIGFVQELIEESLPNRRPSPLTWMAPQGFWIYYLGVLLYWLHDSSPGKQNTLAFLDRSLSVGVSMFKRGKW
jgi:AcrR family transcriptional regulator